MIICSHFYSRYNIRGVTLVRIIALRTLREYWETHRDVEGQLRAWYDRAKRANWQSPAEVKKDYTPNGNKLSFLRIHEEH
jgi:mRNA-degrading endonuclease HigB of HigAB toxin-antitoxin module